MFFAWARAIRDAFRRRNEKSDGRAGRLWKRFLMISLIYTVIGLLTALVMAVIDNSGGNGCAEQPLYWRTFWMAADLVAMVGTTIGYGHILPCTTGGKIFTVVITIIGIPLTLVVLDQVGKVFVFLARKTWGIISRPCRKRKTDKKDITLDMELPLTLGFGVALLWTLITTAYFCMLEKWTFFEALYFTIISLTTVGLGDYSAHMVEYTMINYYFLFIGLALVSMCINILGEKINRAFTRARNELQRRFDEKTIAGEEIPPEEEDMLIRSAVKGQGPISLFFGSGRAGILKQDAKKRLNTASVEVQTDDLPKDAPMVVRGPVRTVERIVERSPARNVVVAPAQPTARPQVRHVSLQVEKRPQRFTTSTQTKPFSGDSSNEPIDISLHDDGTVIRRRARSMSEQRGARANAARQSGSRPRLFPGGGRRDRSRSRRRY